MIEGIDYYPIKRKSNKKPKLLIFLLLLVIVAGYWYFDNKQSSIKPKSTLIVISEPVIEPILNTIPIVIKPSQINQKTPEVLENLDEVMQTYNRETQ